MLVKGGVFSTYLTTRQWFLPQGNESLSHSLKSNEFRKGETFVPFVLFSTLRATKLQKMESENPLLTSSPYFLNHHADSFPVVNGSISTHQNENLPKAPQIFEGWLLPSQSDNDQFSTAVIHGKKKKPMSLPNPKAQPIYNCFQQDVYSVILRTIDSMIN